MEKNSEIHQDINNKKRVLFIAEAMLGGIRQHVLDIAYGLDKEKYEVYLAYSDKRADHAFFQEYEKLASCIQMIRCIHMQRELCLSEDIKAIWELKRIIREIQPDIVHCHSSKAGIVGRIAAKACKIKYVYYTPNAYSFQNPDLGIARKKVYIFAEQILSRMYTTRTINVSKGEMQCALRNRIDKKEKFALIYNGISKEKILDKKEIRRQNGFDKDAVLIGVTARLAPQKDPLTFLEIAKQILKKESKTEFIYIGDGELEQEVQEWIKNNHLENKIHMLGFRDDASKIVGMLDIYLSAALYEGLPYSMIEAMRAGVPIIATNVEGNNELVIEGVNGMLFEKKDVKAGAALCIKQIREGVIKQENVIRTFGERFSSDVMLEKLSSLFDLKENHDKAP